jgi:hypothetical protein
VKRLSVLPGIGCRQVIILRCLRHELRQSNIASGAVHLFGPILPL